MQIVGYIALGIVGLLLLAVILVKIVRHAGEKVLGSLKAAATGRGEEVLRGDGFASFRGRVSDGYPLRGNAALILTNRAFRIHVFWPRPPRVIEVPLERMRRIEVTRAFMGMFDPSGFVVLHVAADGGEDAFAFTVRRLPDWVGDIVKTARPHLLSIQGRQTGGDPEGAVLPEGDAGGAEPVAGSEPAGDADAGGGPGAQDKKTTPEEERPESASSSS
jgi:hypothetical protein